MKEVKRYVKEINSATHWGLNEVVLGADYDALLKLYQKAVAEAEQQYRWRLEELESISGCEIEEGVDMLKYRLSKL